MGRCLVIVLLSGLLGSCATARVSQMSTPTQAAGPAGSIVLAPGQAERVEGTPLTIRFDAVIEDSRCPEGVDCVWAGDVSVKLRLEGGQAPAQEATLHLNTAARETAHGDHRVTLVDVTPHPKANQKIEPKSYRATMRVEKR